jgi:hypothetical protein
MTTGSPELPALIREAGLDAEECPSLLETWRESGLQLDRAREICKPFASDTTAAFACGSLGRREFTDGSDIDLAFLHGPEVSPEDAARRLERMQMELQGAGFEVSTKGLFGTPLARDIVVANIGGDEDTTRYLTFRALIITEGEWITSPAVAKDFSDTIFNAYVQGEVSSGRYATSLTNDLHRYYRTLCVDYRWKVEGNKKHAGWAIRNVKLRHSRKLWHLGTICAECYAFLASQEQGAPPDHRALLSKALKQSSFAKIMGVLRFIGASRTAAGLFRAYDFYLAKMRHTSLRVYLDGLPPEKRETDEVFRALRENARELDIASQEVLWALLGRKDVAKHLLRFGLL